MSEYRDVTNENLALTSQLDSIFPWIERRLTQLTDMWHAEFRRANDLQRENYDLKRKIEQLESKP